MTDPAAITISKAEFQALARERIEALVAHVNARKGGALLSDTEADFGIFAKYLAIEMGDLGAGDAAQLKDTWNATMRNAGGRQVLASLQSEASKQAVAAAVADYVFKDQDALTQEEITNKYNALMKVKGADAFTAQLSLGKDLAALAEKKQAQQIAEKPVDEPKPVVAEVKKPTKKQEDIKPRDVAAADQPDQKEAPAVVAEQPAPPAAADNMALAVKATLAALLNPDYDANSTLFIKKLAEKGALDELLVAANRTRADIAHEKFSIAAIRQEILRNFDAVSSVIAEDFSQSDKAQSVEGLNAYLAEFYSTNQNIQSLQQSALNNPDAFDPYRWSGVAPLAPLAAGEPTVVKPTPGYLDNPDIFPELQKVTVDKGADAAQALYAALFVFEEAKTPIRAGAKRKERKEITATLANDYDALVQELAGKHGMSSEQIRSFHNEILATHERGELGQLTLKESVAQAIAASAAATDPMHAVLDEKTGVTLIFQELEAAFGGPYRDALFSYLKTMDEGLIGQMDSPDNLRPFLMNVAETMFVPIRQRAGILGGGDLTAANINQAFAEYVLNPVADIVVKEERQRSGGHAAVFRDFDGYSARATQALGGLQALTISEADVTQAVLGTENAGGMDYKGLIAAKQSREEEYEQQKRRGTEEVAANLMRTLIPGILGENSFLGQLFAMLPPDIQEAAVQGLTGVLFRAFPGVAKDMDGMVSGLTGSSMADTENKPSSGTDYEALAQKYLHREGATAPAVG